MKKSEDMTEFLIRNGRQWIITQRDRYRPASSPLPEPAYTSLQGFFQRETLESVRISRVPMFENPPFYASYARLQGAILSRLLNFRKVSGITFIDTLVINEKRVGPEPGLSLLFHEVVHVVQYRILGVSEFTRRYVLGWAQNGYAYKKIPLEKQAFELGERFSAGTLHLPVEDEIERTIWELS